MMLFTIVAATILVGLLLALVTRFYLTFIIIMINFAVVLVIVIAALAWGGVSEVNYVWAVQNYFYLGYRPEYLVTGDVAHLGTLIWSTFAHGGFVHLAGNTVFLIFIGLALERKIGKGGIAISYFAASIGASLIYTLLAYITPDSYGMDPAIPSVGASGAIFGLMGTYFALYPKDKILFPMVIIMKWPVWLIATIYFLFNVVVTVAGGNDGTNYAAHVGGFLVGMLVAPIIRRVTKRKGENRPKETPRASMELMRRMAEDQGLEELYEKIDKEDIPDIKVVWTEELLRKARCPKCGKGMAVKDGRARCRCGFDLRY